MTETAPRPYEEVRKAWQAGNVRPLWESVLAHKVREGGPKPTHWPWRLMRTFVDDAMRVTTPAAANSPTSARNASIW